MKVFDVTISDACRETHGGAAAALEVAVDQLREQALQIFSAWPRGRGLSVTLEVHYQRPAAVTEADTRPSTTAVQP